MAHSPLKRPPGTLVELALGTAWLLGLAAALQLIDKLIGHSPLAAALGGAAVADIAAGRAGVRWSDPAETAAPGARSRLARRIGAGAALGALPALVTLALAVVMGMASVSAGHLSTSLAFSVVRAVALAVRDELLLTGIALVTAARAGVPLPFALTFAALAHGAMFALVPGASAAAVALAVASGALSAILWSRWRSAWPAIAASAAWTVLAGAGFRGSLLDATWTNGTLALGARPFGPPAWIAAGIFAVLAALAALLHPWSSDRRVR